MQGLGNTKWQALFTTAGVVAFVMCILIGVTVALASAAAFGVHIYASAVVGLCAGSLGEVTLF